MGALWHGGARRSRGAAWCRGGRIRECRGAGHEPASPSLPAGGANFDKIDFTWNVRRRNARKKRPKVVNRDHLDRWNHDLAAEQPHIVVMTSVDPHFTSVGKLIARRFLCGAMRMILNLNSNGLEPMSNAFSTRDCCKTQDLRNSPGGPRGRGRLSEATTRAVG